MDKLFCDLKTDEEKAAFFLSGRGYETGVISQAIQNDVAMAYQRCAEYRKELEALQSRDKGDAERYRWLRDSALLFSQIEQPGVSGWMVGRRDHVKARFYTYNGKELDEAIDHARHAGGKTG